MAGADLASREKGKGKREKPLIRRLLTQTPPSPARGEGGAQSATDEADLPILIPQRLNKPVQPLYFLLQYARILNQDLASVDFDTDDFESCERA